MKKPFKNKPLQNMSPASIMEAGRHASSYWAHRPRAPDIDYLIPGSIMNTKHVSAILGLHVIK